MSDNLKSKIENPKWLGDSTQCAGAGGQGDQMKVGSWQWSIVSITLCAMLFALCSSVEAQQPNKIPRIVFLSVQPPAILSARFDAFRRGLRELGYVEGKNIVIEYLHSEGSQDRLPAVVAELVRRQTDVIVTGGSQATRAAKEGTSTIPIVMAQDNDPLGAGFVASLARPGGNVTGLANLTAELSGKQLELLKEILPKLARLAVLSDATEPGNPQAVKATDAAAKGFGVQVFYMDVQAQRDIEPAFRAASDKRAEALLVMPTPAMNQRRKQIAGLAMKSRLPAIYPRAEYVEDGGLMMYGVNTNDLFRRAAIFVDKILKGAKPADLPVEQPIKFEFLINLKTAKQIGLTIPPNVLARADKVIR
jgi:putative ABC transport system substrate-binding protein